MARLTWSPLAIEDLKSIVLTIAKDSPVYAKRFGLKLKNSPKQLRRFPMRGWVVPEFNDPTLREIVVDPYRIIYRVRTREIVVLAIVHGMRDLKRNFPTLPLEE